VISVTSLAGAAAAGRGRAGGGRGARALAGGTPALTAGARRRGGERATEADDAQPRGCGMFLGL